VETKPPPEIPEFEDEKRRGREGGPQSLISQTRLQHVNNSLTPLAILVVAPALIVAPLSRLVLIAATALITYSVFLNYLSVYLHARNIQVMGFIRVGSNYVVNIGLLWLLYEHWPLIWLLLLLMSVGVAIYQPLRDSLTTAAAMALLLLAVHWTFGEQSALEWAEVIAQACVLILFNLFVNGLMRIERRMNGEQGGGFGSARATPNSGD